MNKRLFLIILDSFGIGGAPDAAEFGDEGSNTLAGIANSEKFFAPNLKKMGLFNIDDVTVGEKESEPMGAFARLQEVSKGKDTTIGHWEIAGVESNKALPTFPDGFPQNLLDDFSKKTGCKILCNKPYSGTDVIRDFGEEQMRTKGLIVYTSADSVFQIAANEAVIPLEKLYEYCEIAREMLVGDYAVGRVIARPFEGDVAANFKRTTNRHDFSILPPQPTLLDALTENCYDMIGVGKIYDIFAGKGVTRKIATKSNNEGMQTTMDLASEEFEGLCFVNLVDFDMLFGHRNDVDGYANAISEFDKNLGDFLEIMQPNDILMITADHGCDPSTQSTDHSRECVPWLIAGKPIKKGVNLGTQKSFGCIANTIAEWFELEAKYVGKSVLEDILNDEEPTEAHNLDLC